MLLHRHFTNKPPSGDWFFVVVKRLLKALLEDQHCIAVGEETIPRPKGFLICSQDPLPARKSANKHEESRPRLMKISKKDVNRLEGIPRCDEEPRFVGN